MEELTLAELVRVTRSRAGEAEDGVLNGDILDVLFEQLGYDSVALLEVLSEINHEYGLDLSEQTVASLKTPRAVLDTVNRIISERGVKS